MSVLAITNVVNISVANPPAGLQDYRINNLALFTKEVPLSPLSGDYAVYLDPAAVADDWGTNSEVYAQAVAIFSQTPNILDGGGQLIVVPMESGDTLTTMLEDIAAQIYFGGAIYGGYAPDDAELLAAAEAYQAAKKMLFVSQYQTTALDGGGIFNEIQAASLTYARCLLYTPGATQARLMAAAYAGRAMCVEFEGSNTMLTMHLKDLVGITPDPGITQTILETCKTVGADVYAYIGPLPKVFSTGGNTFYDQVYGTLWLIFKLQVNVFNALATTFTKIPQTEAGMSILRNAVTAALQVAVRNGFAAPGAWNSPQLFGNPDDLRENVRLYGWYVYSVPVNEQSQAEREDREAPLIQAAVKLAGAVQSANVIVYLNP